MISAWGICVDQLLIHKPVVMYADMKKKGVCPECGETDPKQFYSKRSICKSCCAKKLKVWRKEGATERMATCICGKQFPTIKPNAKYCGPVCRNKGERDARRERNASRRKV